MKHESKIKSWKTIAAVAAIVLIGWMGVLILSSPLENETEVIINEGAGVYVIADILAKEGVIDNKFIFVTYSLITGNEKKLQAGRYIFKPGTTIPIIVYSMARGLAESDDIETTIPEGSNIWEIDKELTKAGLIAKGTFAQEFKDKEGYLFPDTYRFKKPVEAGIMNNELWAKEIGNKMSRNFEDKTREIFESLNIQKQKEIIILASMLEKEAKTEEDMRLVAGIIKNRLERGMLLQIDATVAYGACFRQMNCDVTLVGVANEIKIDGSYNTYTRVGLPPGPISNPGLQALEAALKPADTDFLYYLSSRDGSRVIFSKTSAEHAANRRKYLGI